MRRLTAFLTLLMIMIIVSTKCFAETDPLWMKASDDKLNARVDNPTYTMTVLHSWSPQKSAIYGERMHVLEKYVKENYGAVPSSIRIDSVSGGSQPVYWVNFNTEARDNNFIAAKLVDDYAKYDDYEHNVYQYEFYYLFALSHLNEYPQYDEFVNHYPDNKKALAMSIIPGVGQIYKGQNKKGYLIMAGEVGFGLAALYFESQRRYCYKEYKKEDPQLYKSWRSKTTAWRNFRNGALGCMAGVYIYNLLDAALTAGGSDFTIHKIHPNNVYVTPWADSDFVGLSLSLSF